MRVRDEINDDEASSDGRRARLADVQRLETALAQAAGQLKAMQEFLSKRDETPVPKAQFYAQFYVMSVLSGRNFKHLRHMADSAWKSYTDSMDGKPAPTLSEIYGSSASAESPSNDNPV
ncbi:MAG: hypothetical protein VKP62_16775 [Candidatus Sericytochromatia bacterium]|nr:hypothetical protein [Candidatus Sericytochromatia bacterium]